MCDLSGGAHYEKACAVCCINASMVVLAFPTLANAQTSIDVADTAQLIAKGAGAVVSVEITCAVPTNNVSIDVTLVQRAGSKTTSGSGNVGGFPSDINCTPEPTTVEVPVAVFGRVFKQGVAIALANISECNPDFSNCFSGHATQEIRLVK